MNSAMVLHVIKII